MLTHSPQTEGLSLGVVEVLAQYEHLVPGPRVEDIGVCSLL